MLSLLEHYLMHEGMKNIASLRDVCHVLTDPLLALRFTPVNHQRRHLTLAEVHKHIDVVRALETNISDEAHCALGVCFVGFTRRELKKLLRDVQSPFRRQPHSRMSTKSTQSYMSSHFASDVAWQSTHTRLGVQTITVGYAPLDVTW